MTTRAAIPLTIGVTSHRNLVASEVEAIRQGVRDFLVRMRREYPNMPLVVVSALADGGDQLVAEEALAAGARLIAPLPLARALHGCAADLPLGRRLGGGAPRRRRSVLSRHDRRARRAVGLGEVDAAPHPRRHRRCRRR